MKVIKEKIDLDHYYADVSEIIIDSNDENLVFIDTNILIWLYRLNYDSFNEFSKFLTNLSAHDTLVIPVWVIHEYNNLLKSNSELIFFPYKKQLKALELELGKLLETARLLVDNDFSIRQGFTNKRGFIEQIKKESESLSKIIKQLNDKNNFKNEERREFIEELISQNSSSTKINDLIKDTDNYDFRYSHLIPPGFEDNLKEINKYGDILIWKDILINAKNSTNGIKHLFLSFDTKKDWVYTPQKVIKNSNIIINNIEPRFQFILPSLEQEFLEQTSSQIIFANIRQLIDVLYSPDYNSMDFADYKNLAKTENIELNNNETNRIIEWFMVNEENLNHLTNTICNWKRSPDEVDLDELKKWAKININLKIDFDKVNWNDVFVQLFI